jgi:hypothetical protein
MIKPVPKSTIDAGSGTGAGGAELLCPHAVRIEFSKKKSPSNEVMVTLYRPEVFNLKRPSKDEPKSLLPP